MSYLTQIQRGVDLVETRLDEDLPLGDIARAAGMSLWHFQRIFKALTNETLKGYVRSRRMALALDRLRTTDTRIIEIALAAGYDSQAAFTRAFKQAFGITPHQYRRAGQRSAMLKKVQLTEAYLAHLQTGISLTPEIVERSSVHVVGARTEFFGTGSEKNNIGARIPALWEGFLPRLVDIPQRVVGECYGVIEAFDPDEECLEYIAAAPIESGAAASVPSGMVSRILPAGRYAQFEHRGHPKNLDHTVSYIYSSWLLGSGFRHRGGPDLEIYGHDYVADSDDSVIRYAIPV